MKQLRFMQMSGQGKIDGVMRFIGKNIFIKVNNTQYLDKMIQEIEKKGAKVEKGNEWVKIDIFGQAKSARLGLYEFDFEEDSEELIEANLARFYYGQYKKGGFAVIQSNGLKSE